MTLTLILTQDWELYEDNIPDPYSYLDSGWELYEDSLADPDPDHHLD